MLVSQVVGAAHAKHALMHDAAEAYLGDVTKPLKALLPQYNAIESRIEHALWQAFSLPDRLHHSIKRADLVLLATEQRDLMPPHDDVWPVLEGIQPLEHRIEPWTPQRSMEAFMVRATELDIVGGIS